MIVCAAESCAQLHRSRPPGTCLVADRRLGPWVFEVSRHALRDSFLTRHLRGLCVRACVGVCRGYSMEIIPYKWSDAGHLRSLCARMTHTQKLRRVQALRPEFHFVIGLPNVGPEHLPHHIKPLFVLEDVQPVVRHML